MESTLDHAQFPTFTLRKASLKRWASKESIISIGAQAETKSSPRQEPLMRVRPDGKLIFPAWPALKSSNPQGAPTVTMTSLDEPLPSATPLGHGLKLILPGTSWSSRKREAQQSKRKPSCSDLESSPMTTVQEISLDSPTIPGHLPGRPMHPGIERSLSVPDHALRHFSEDGNDRTPRASEFPKVGKVEMTPSCARSDFLSNQMGRRSTLLSSKDLKPLVVSTVSEPEDIFEATRPNALNDASAIPPEVPPKSPRTESRASPRNRRDPHSANGSVSAIQSVASLTPSHSYQENWSPRPLRTPNRNESPSSLRGLENAVPRDSPSARNEVSSTQLHSLENLTTIFPATPWTKTGRSQSPPVRSTPISRRPSRSPMRYETVEEDFASTVPTNHHRGRSDPVCFDKNYSMSTRHGDTTSIYGLIRTIGKSPTQCSDSKDLPTGFRVIDASTKVPEAEAKTLKKQADRHVESFEVLRIKDVSMLSQELELLDERCEYLQSTQKSLRQGRRNLHTRMITYLRSPRMVNFSRESILKQEEALAELDISIDDWVAKLEAAEERRTRIRQKLLEHVAAALTLQTAAISATPYEEATPPISPEHGADCFSIARREVQSIRIYADEGVATLLAEIKKDIDLIAEPDKSNQSP